MKARIDETKRYRITIGEDSFDDFKKESSWEGMTKFSGPHGIFIVSGQEKGCFENILADVFDFEIQEYKETYDKVTVISAGGKILDSLMKEKLEEAKTNEKLYLRKRR